MLPELEISNGHRVRQEREDSKPSCDEATWKLLLLLKTILIFIRPLKVNKKKNILQSDTQRLPNVKMKPFSMMFYQPAS